MGLTQKQPLLPPIKEERLLPTRSVHYTQEGWFPRSLFVGNWVAENYGSRRLVSKPLRYPVSGLLQDRALTQDRKQLLKTDIRNIGALTISNDGCV
jgi:hypothetical protein